MAEPQEVKTAQVILADKALKYDRNNKPFYELTLTKDNRDVKMRCFEENKNGFAQCKDTLKNQSYSVEFVETRAKGRDGNDVTYRNIISIGAPQSQATGASSAGSPATTTQAQSSPANTPAPAQRTLVFDAHEIAIMREVALKAAVDYASHAIVINEANETVRLPITELDIIEAASMFEQYLLTGKVPVEAK